MRHERLIALRSEILAKSGEMVADCGSGNLDTLVAHFAAYAYLLRKVGERPG